MLDIKTIKTSSHLYPACPLFPCFLAPQVNSRNRQCKSPADATRSMHLAHSLLYPEAHSKPKLQTALHALQWYRGCRGLVRNAKQNKLPKEGGGGGFTGMAISSRKSRVGGRGPRHVSPECEGVRGKQSDGASRAGAGHKVRGNGQGVRSSNL
eukprot:scaffold39040_cov21-Tisochrysis_lutea.AAC.2